MSTDGSAEIDMKLRLRLTARTMAIACVMCCLLAAGARADSGQGSTPGSRAEAFTALTQRVLDEYYDKLDPDERGHEIGRAHV